MAQEHEASTLDGLAAPAQARAATWITTLRAQHQTTTHNPRETIPGISATSRNHESFTHLRRLLELAGSNSDAPTQSLTLRNIAHDLPKSTPTRERFAVQTASVLSLGLPWAIMPITRRLMRERVSPLVLTTKLQDTNTPPRLPGLNKTLTQHYKAGFVPVLAPCGNNIHGPESVTASLKQLFTLIAHPQVTHLAINPARLVPHTHDWATTANTTHLATALTQLFAKAQEHDTLIILEPCNVHWARQLPEVLVRALADPSLDNARVSVRLLAELPESINHYEQLRRWAKQRVAHGGAPAEIVIAVGGVIGEERIASILNGLPVPVLEGRTNVGSHMLRLAQLALHQNRAKILHPVFESEDAHLLAAIIETAHKHNPNHHLTIQMRAGICPDLAELVRQSVPETRIHLPVVSPEEFGGAIPKIIAYAAEAADHTSAIARLETILDTNSPLTLNPHTPPTTPSTAETAYTKEVTNHKHNQARNHETPPTTHRTQLREQEQDPSERDSALFYRPPDEPPHHNTGGLTAAVLGLKRDTTGQIQLTSITPPRPIPVIHGSGFACEPDTDASIPANRQWAQKLLQTAATNTARQDQLDTTITLSAAERHPTNTATTARNAATQWSQLTHQQRAQRLRQAALATATARHRLIQTLATDTGAPINELDSETNNTIDAARYYGKLAEQLATVRGATFTPEHLALIVGCNETPLSFQAEAVLATLAAGSAALWAVPLHLLTSAETLLHEWKTGGIPDGAVRIEGIIRDETVTEIAAHQSIDRALVFGDRTLATHIVKTRPELRVEGRFQQCGAILVTSSADIDQAVHDIVSSAWRGAGADPRTAHAVILVGAAARSKHFRKALKDAVQALKTGDTSHPNDQDPLSFNVGPLPQTPGDAGLHALTRLTQGESWLVKPTQLDTQGRLWHPGVRWGVAHSSPFWEHAQNVPVIGVTHASSLASAVALQNRIGGGAVAGLHSYDPDEILYWLGAVEAATLSVNRPTTDTRIERQPVGGRGNSVMGVMTFSGGPNRLLQLGSWSARTGTRSETLHLRGLDPEVQLLIETAQSSLSYEEFDGVRRAALSDAIIWRTSFGIVHDTIGLGVERNVLRYETVPTQIRLAEGASLAQLLRVLAVVFLIRVPVALSTGVVLSAELSQLLAKQGISVSLERDDDWVLRLAATGPLITEGVLAERVRLIGGDRVRAAEWMGGLDRAALWAEPVTMAGPVELLTLLREQSVSARAHRYGLAVGVPGLDELCRGGVVSAADVSGLTR